MASLVVVAGGSLQLHSLERELRGNGSRREPKWVGGRAGVGGEGGGRAGEGNEGKTRDWPNSLPCLFRAWAFPGAASN